MDSFKDFIPRSLSQKKLETIVNYQLFMQRPHDFLIIQRRGSQAECYVDGR
ncbi:hypothetical protein [Enteractinococcus coprophilus]|uniref:hypothetical protein n=1 Tax=Enteractinococcus coprophilus TaxID=1027633 RepID=UPI001FE4B3EC|nr:hypothetical protein [Enteractinococcus coprophilus]